MEVYELKLRDYIDLVYKRKWTVLIVFSIVFFGFFAYTNMQTPMYKTTVTFKVSTLYSFLPSEFLYGRQQQMRMSPTEALSDYMRQIMGRPIVIRAMTELGWLNDDLSDDQKQFLIDKVQGNLSAEVIPKTNMIRLQVLYDNPKKAAAIANEIFDVFKIENIKEKNKKKHNVSVFIQNRLSEVSKELQEKEKRLRVLITHGVVGIAENLLKQIDSLEKERIKLLSVYTERYPGVLALNEQIEELKAELKSLPKEEFEYGVLKRDIGIDQELYNSLKSKLQASQIQEADKVDNIVLINNAAPPRSAAYPQKVKNYLLGMLLGGFLGIACAVLMEQVMETSIGRVEDIEALIKVSIVGVIPYFAEKDESKGKKLKRFLTKSKEDASSKVKSRLIARHSEGSIFVEAFRILGANIQVTLGEAGRIKNKLIMITSSNPSEGKSMISSNLAIVLAQMGYKTLIVDTDLRRSTVHKMFGLRERGNGLTDILMDKIKHEEIETAVVKTATDLMLGDVGPENIMEKPWMNNLHILTAGSVFPNPIHLFNSDKLRALVGTLKDKYNVVIFDSSPLLAVSDPSILLPLVDGVFLVYRVGATPRLTLRRCKTHVESIKGKGSVNGLILNNVVPELSMDSCYYYHRKYYTSETKKEGSEEGNVKEG